MRRAIWLLAVCALVIAAAWWLAGLPGQVTANVAGYSIETATPLALLLFVVLLGVLYLLMRLIFAIIFLPRSWRAWRGRAHRRAGDIAVTQTLIALAAGEKGEARRQSQRARRLLGDTPQTLLLAAESGRLSGNDAEAAAIYQILTEREDAAFLGLRGLFRQAMARESWDEAAQLAKRAAAVQPGAAWLRDERTQLAVRTGNWSEAFALAGPDAPRIAFATAAAEAATDPTAALRLAKRAWKDDPGFTPACLAYASRLRAAGRESKAQSIVRTSWEAAPNPELARFALAQTTDAAARLKLGEHLAAANPRHPESHFLLARLALDAGAISDARTHLQAAQNAGMREKRLWLLRLELEAADHGDSPVGRAAQRDALMEAATADPDATWTCTSCGTRQTQWHPTCPTCHTPGHITWTAPTRLALAAQ